MSVPTSNSLACKTINLQSGTTDQTAEIRWETFLEEIHNLSAMDKEQKEPFIKRCEEMLQALHKYPSTEENEARKIDVLFIYASECLYKQGAYDQCTTVLFKALKAMIEGSLTDKSSLEKISSPPQGTNQEEELTSILKSLEDHTVSNPFQLEQLLIKLCFSTQNGTGLPFNLINTLHMKASEAIMEQVPTPGYENHKRFTYALTIPPEYFRNREVRFAEFLYNRAVIPLYYFPKEQALQFMFNTYDTVITKLKDTLGEQNTYFLQKTAQVLNMKRKYSNDNPKQRLGLSKEAVVTYQKILADTSSESSINEVSRKLLFNATTFFVVDLMQCRGKIDQTEFKELEKRCHTVMIQMQDYVNKHERSSYTKSYEDALKLYKMARFSPEIASDPTALKV